MNRFFDLHTLYNLHVMNEVRAKEEVVSVKNFLSTFSSLYLKNSSFFSRAG